MRFSLSILWLASLYLLLLLTSSKTGFLYSYEADAIVVEKPEVFWHLANFDGAHYQNIARYGYILKFQTAFFPLYPLLTRGLGIIFGNQLIAGLSLSLLFTTTTLFLFSRLIKSTVAYLAFITFPLSFYLITNYTESLFLTLSLSTWLLFTRKNYFWAGLIGFLACLSRFYGILLFPALLIYFLHHRPTSPKKILPIFLMPLGLLVYMYYLNDRYQDPLSFIHSLSLWQKSVITFPLQTVYRYLKIFLTVSPRLYVYQIAVLEMVALIFGTLATFLFLRRRALAESTYVFLGVLIPTLTGTLQSLPRYLFVLFPIFYLYKKIPLRFAWLIFVFSLALQYYLYLNFLAGRFVS